ASGCRSRCIATTRAAPSPMPISQPSFAGATGVPARSPPRAAAPLCPQAPAARRRVRWPSEGSDDGPIRAPQRPRARPLLADRDQLELALVENLQRADLGPLEEAHAFQALSTDFGLTHEEIAQRVGRAKSTVTNTLRLLDLDPSVQTAIVDGTLTAGHARA